jgi:hypothetical protein
MALEKYESNPQTVLDIANLFKEGRLNLEPVFQRQTVWGRSQRQKLLDSIIHGYPIPSVFFYRRIDEATGQMVFEVIDGKQRLETLFMYMGLIRRRTNGQSGGRRRRLPDKLTVPIQISERDSPEPMDWKQLCKLKQGYRIEGYSLQVTFVTSSNVSGSLPRRAISQDLRLL